MLSKYSKGEINCAIYSIFGIVGTIGLFGCGYILKSTIIIPLYFMTFLIFAMTLMSLIGLICALNLAINKKLGAIKHVLMNKELK